MNYVGIDWAYRRAAWCALTEAGEIKGEGMIPADGDGLARLVVDLGTDVRARVETMSGAVWVKDQLEACGWSVDVANAGKVRDIAPLACKTDKVDARVLAELCRRDLVPAVWVASLADRAIRERLRRRAHLVKARTGAHNRIFDLLTRSGFGSPSPACASPTRSTCSSAAAFRRSGATRSPSTSTRSTRSSDGSGRSIASFGRSPAPIPGPGCCRRSPESGL